MTKKGSRIGAILEMAEDGEVYFLGYGIYEGDFVPTDAVGWMAEALREEKSINPRLRLDDGSVAWGCECWWGSEEKVKKTLQGKVVHQVSINDVRAKWKKQEGQ